MPFDPQSSNKTLLRSNSFFGIGELAIYHAQLLKIDAKLAFLFEQKSLQSCAHRWIELPSELIHEFFDIMVTNKFGHRVHGKPFS
jgi:hypothetical protein